MQSLSTSEIDECREICRQNNWTARVSADTSEIVIFAPYEKAEEIFKRQFPSRSIQLTQTEEELKKIRMYRNDPIGYAALYVNDADEFEALVRLVKSKTMKSNGVS